MIIIHTSLQIFKLVFLGVLDYGLIFVSWIPDDVKEDRPIVLQ